MGRVPRVIGDFEIIAELGAGGMGAVYKARQRSLDRLVALKILPEHAAADPEFVERFVREARATAKLNHPHIVAGIDVGESGGYHYFAMEFINGMTLRSKIEQEGMLNEKEAARIGAAIASALAHAHAAGIIHRDVKPDNILMDSDGAPKLADLGCAKGLAVGHDNALTQTGSTLGTPHYMSPEQASGEKKLDGRCDMYSLGCTLFHATTGTTPFDAATPALMMVKHISEPIPPVRSIRRGLSEGFSAAISRMVAKRRDDRYPDLTEVAEDLDALASGLPPPHCQKRATRVAVPHATLDRESRSRTQPASKRVKPEPQPLPKYVWPVVLGIPVLGLIAVMALSGSKESQLAGTPGSPGAQPSQPVRSEERPPALPAPAPVSPPVPVGPPAERSPEPQHAPALPPPEYAAPAVKATRYWVGQHEGAFTSSNWAMASGGAPGAAVPGREDIVAFDEKGPADCTLDAANVAGLVVAAGYRGKIRQAPGAALQFGASGFLQRAGTFVGSDAEISIAGDCTLRGGTFTSTRGVLQVAGKLDLSGSAFTHNSGTIKLGGDFEAGNAVLQNLSIELPNAAASCTVSRNVNVSGNLELASLSVLDGGTLIVQGNVHSTATHCSGTATVVLAGERNQVLSGKNGAMPAVVVDKTGGTLTLRDCIVLDGDVRTIWKYVKGSVDPGDATIWIAGNNSSIASGEMAFQNLKIDLKNFASNFTPDGTVRVRGNLTIEHVGMLTGGTLAVSGNVTTTNTRGDGTCGNATILFNGSGDQTLSAGGGKGMLPGLAIEKSGGVLTISDTIHLDGTTGWTYKSGTVETGASTIVASGNGMTIDAGPVKFNNFTIKVSNPNSNLTILGTLDVKKNLSVICGQINCKGSIRVAGRTLTPEEIDKLSAH